MKSIFRLPAGSRLVWLVIYLSGFLLLSRSLPDISRNIRQVALLHILRQAASGQVAGYLDNPFLCARTPLGSSGVQTTLQSILSSLQFGGISSRLDAAAYCLMGEPEAAMIAYQSTGRHDLFTSLQQYLILAKEGDSLKGIQILTTAHLSDDEWSLASDVIVYRAPQIDPRPILRVLAERNAADIQTWILWIRGGSQVQQIDGGAGALSWYREGLTYPPILAGSLALRAGRVLQTAENPRDPHAALAYYNQALASGGFMNKEDESNVFMFRGEVYRSLPQEYSTTQSLAEFDHALEINPDSFYAWLARGHVFLYDLHDPTRAEPNYHRALLLNVKSAYAYFYLGDVYRARGDLEHAKEYYRQAKGLNPDWPAPQLRLKSLENSQEK